MVKKYEIRGETGNLKTIADELKKLTLGDEEKLSEPVNAKAKKSQGRLVLISAIGAAVVLVVAAVLIFKSLSQPAITKFAVPRVVGKDIQAATAAVRQAKLRAIVKYDPASTKTAGTVISTKPAAGTRIEDGGTVTLVVAGKAPQSGTVPALKSGVPETSSASATSTTTVTEPAPGNTTTPPPAGETLRIVVGPPPTEAEKTVVPAEGKIEVPDIEGMVDARARKKLEDLGLQVETSAGEDSALPAGVVIASTPKPGALVAKGSTVRLQVNARKGPDTAVEQLSDVKNYVGATAEVASKDLRERGLTPVVVYEATRLYRAGTVIRTNPPAGSQLPRGSQVTLYVAR